MFMKMLAQSFASDFYYINYPLPSFRFKAGKQYTDGHCLQFANHYPA